MLDQGQPGMHAVVPGQLFSKCNGIETNELRR